MVRTRRSRDPRRVDLARRGDHLARQRGERGRRPRQHHRGRLPPGGRRSAGGRRARRWSAQAPPRPGCQLTRSAPRPSAAARQPGGCRIGRAAAPPRAGEPSESAASPSSRWSPLMLLAGFVRGNLRRATGLLPRHGRGRAPLALSRPSLRPAVRDRALHRGHFVADAGGVAAGGSPRRGDQSRPALARRRGGPPRRPGAAAVGVRGHHPPAATPATQQRLRTATATPATRQRQQAATTATKTTSGRTESRQRSGGE